MRGFIFICCFLIVFSRSTSAQKKYLQPLLNYTADVIGNWSLLTSVFNGKVANVDDRFYERWKLHIRNDGLLSVSELKYISDADKPLLSIYGVGLGFHNKSFVSIKDDTKSYEDNYTLYAFGEHDFYRSSGKNAGVFLQASYSPKDRNIGYAYTAAGLVMNGFLTSDNRDRVGIGLSQLYYQQVDDNKRVSNKMGNIIEAFALFPLNKSVSVKPAFFLIADASRTCIIGAMMRVYVNVF